MLLEWNRLDKNKFTDVQSVATLLETYRADLVALLNGGLFLGQNAKCALVEVDCQHGVQSPLGFPRGFKPRAFWPFEAETVAVVSGSPNRPLGTFQQMVGNPVLDFTRPDGLLGITVQYAPPLGLVSLYNTANQPINNVTVAPITWDAEIAKVGALAHSNTVNPTRITCNAAGSVLLTFNGAFQAAAAGTRSCWTGKNGDSAALNRRRGAQSAPGVAPANYFSSSMSGDALWEVSVGDYLEVFGYQDSGGALNFRGGGGSENSLAWAQYVAPDPSTTARVRGLLVGG